MENNIKTNKILDLLTEKLKGVDYAFIGSINLYIQGIKTEIRDIDILTTPEEIKKIDEILKEYRTKEIHFDETGGRNSFRSFYKINNIEIEVLGNVGNIYRDPKSLDKNFFVKFHGCLLPIIPLEIELDTYTKLGRIDKIEIIKRFLQTENKII